MIDHLMIKVRDLARSRQFYESALKPLGIVVRGEYGPWIGMGRPGGRSPFWFAQGNVPEPLHFAFPADSRAAVDAFYQAALAAGAPDNGAPGPRPQYHTDYYGAFVLDPDGNNIEAVCHVAPGAAAARKARPTAKKPAKNAVKRGTPKRAAAKKPAKKRAAAKGKRRR